jgi:MtN3 and saliva related transmembrane protein
MLLALQTQGETHAYRASMKSTEAIGWASSAILLLTIMRQVYTQWKTKSTAGVSQWLFIGQLTASIGYVIYSFLLRNWVFVSSNIALLITAIVGQCLYLHNRSRAKSA